MRVIVFGAGVMGSNHIRVLEKSSWIREVLVIDKFKKLENASQKTKQINLEQLDEHSSVDYAVIATPTTLHAEFAMLCARYGIPTLIEKPVSSNSQEAKQISIEFEKANTPCWVGFVERFNPAVQVLRSKLSEGVVGKVLQISTKRVGPFPVRVNDVGVVLDLASHDVDLVRWLSNSEYVSTSSHLHISDNSPFEEGYIGIGRLADGTAVQHEVNWLTPVKRRSLAVLGTQGMLEADLLNAELKLFEFGKSASEWEPYQQLRGLSEGTVTQFPVPVKEPLVLEHEALRLELEYKSKSDLCTVQDGILDMLVIEGLLK
jgi:UDP-N-acetylglucosamine 3-dehydrogenase